MQNEFIEIVSPKSYEYIGAKFDITGYVDLSYFDTDYGKSDFRMSLEYIELNKHTFMGSAPEPSLDDSNVKNGKVFFRLPCRLVPMNIHALERSHGRITIRIESIHNKNILPLYLPLIVRQFETALTTDPNIEKQHSKVGNVITQYERELKDYYQEKTKILESRKMKDEGKSYDYLYGSSVIMAHDIFKILEGDDEILDGYPYLEEDRREEELDEKYKDALEWRGPLARGIVSQFSGFELRVYSDDHDKHFHIIHRSKGINARFSFPNIQLINYKTSKSVISSRMEKKIREYCLQSEIFKKFEEEFNKRNSYL